MNDAPHPALLPAGIYDLLPPEAEIEAAVTARMIGVRADMTPQVARIAGTRLLHRPRPLRLSYAGQVLRVKGSEMRPERQTGQAGAELIGAEGPPADVEAVAGAAEALQAVGVPHLSVDS